MFAVHPKLAKEFAAKTLSIKNLPEKKREGEKQRMMKMMERK